MPLKIFTRHTGRNAVSGLAEAPTASKFISWLSDDAAGVMSSASLPTVWGAV